MAGTAFAAEVTYERILNADSDPANWLTVNQNYSSHRHSGATQITKENVGQLRLAYAVALGGLVKQSMFGGGTLQGTPLVVDGFLYATDGWSTLYKIDVNPGEAQGRILWMTDPDVDPSTTVLPVNRGVAILGNTVYLPTTDGRMLAVDAGSGEVLWEKQATDGPAESFTDAPLAIKDKIVIGQSSGDIGSRGYLIALNPESGDEIWRTYVVPAPGEPGSETWLDNHGAWKTGGGGLWVTGSYDPESNLTIWGTGNPAPMYDPEFRPGDNLFTNSSVALDVDSGAMKWYFQATPGDYMDYDDIGTRLLYDVTFNGETRKIVGHFGRNGFYYSNDRNSGEFLAGSQYVEQLTWTEGLDPKTGMPVGYQPGAALQEYRAGMAPRRGGPEVAFCPNIQGGVNQFPTSYDPSRTTAYGAGIESCSTTKTEAMDEEKDWRGQLFIGGGGTAAPQRATGGIWATDATTGQHKATAEYPYPNYGGVVTTATGLIFTGWIDGRFTAWDSDTMQELWGVNVGTGFHAPPMVFMVGDQQYVAIYGGPGTGVLGGGAGFGAPELATMQNASTLWVFAL
jgi:alcohol dehydrogenase (cytochrome c)